METTKRSKLGELEDLAEEVSKKLMEKSESLKDEEDPTVKLTVDNFFEVISRNRIVVVDFWAPWCAPCFLYEPAFKRVAKKYKGAAVFGRVNVDENSKIADEFQVLNIPTTLIIVNGKVADIVVGAVGEEILEEHLKRFL